MGRVTATADTFGTWLHDCACMHANSQHMSNKTLLEGLVATCPDNYGNQSAGTFFASSPLQTTP